MLRKSESQRTVSGSHTRPLSSNNIIWNSPKWCYAARKVTAGQIKSNSSPQLALWLYKVTCITCCLHTGISSSQNTCIKQGAISTLHFTLQVAASVPETTKFKTLVNGQAHKDIWTECKYTYGFELGHMLAVNDAFTVGRRETETVHSKTHVQQLPHVTCAERILWANNIA